MSSSLALEGVKAMSGSDAVPDTGLDLSLSPEASALLHKNLSMLRILLNAGVRNSALQSKVVSALRADSSVKAAVAKVVEALKAGKLSASSPSATDVAVALAHFDLFALVFPSSNVNEEDEKAVAAWFAATTSVPSVHSVLNAHNLVTGGRVRVGGQVDARPRPERVAKLADASIALNKGYKKAASQRDNEKEKAASAGAGAAAAPAATPAPAVAAVAAAASQPESNKTLPDMPADERIALCEARLRELSISDFTTTRHAAAKTVEDLIAAIGSLPGLKAKNLFVKAKKERPGNPTDSRLWLVIAAHDSDTNLKTVATKLGYGSIVIRFAEAAELLENLGTVQGHVSPFALANDKALKVQVCVDSKLLKATKEQPAYFHPLDNTASTAVTGEQLAAFIAATGHAMTVVDF